MAKNNRELVNNKLLTLRLPQEVADRYAELCASKGQGVSGELRRFVFMELSKAEKEKQV